MTPDRFRRRIAECLVLGCTTWPLLAAAAPPPPRSGPTTAPALPPALQRRLELELLPAVDADDAPLTLSVARELARRLTAAQLDSIDARLADAGRPSLARLLTDARLRLIVEGRSGADDRPEGKELLFALRGLRQWTDELLALQDGDDSSREPSADDSLDLDAYERRLWDLHVLDNRVQSGLFAARQGVRWMEQKRTIATRSLQAEDQELLSVDFADVERRLVALRRELEARADVLRIRRLDAAVRLLEGSKRAQERIPAAFVVDSDGPTLVERYAAEPPGGPAEAIAAPATLDPAALRRRDLTRPELGVVVRRMVERGRAAAGDDLLAKSRLFYVGLHWWLRGRYGRGVEARGLLKPAAALQSADAMFALYMPAEPPRPADPFASDAASPEIDRRHHYLWQIGAQRIEEREHGSRTTTVGGRIDEVQRITTRKFY